MRRAVRDSRPPRPSLPRGRGPPCTQRKAYPSSHTAERTVLPSSHSSSGVRSLFWVPPRPGKAPRTGATSINGGMCGPILSGLAGLRSDSTGHPDAVEGHLVLPRTHRDEMTHWVAPAMKAGPPRPLATSEAPLLLPPSHGSRGRVPDRPTVGHPAQRAVGSRNSVPGDGVAPKLRNTVGGPLTSSHAPDDRPTVREQFDLCERTLGPARTCCPARTVGAEPSHSRTKRIEGSTPAGPLAGASVLRPQPCTQSTLLPGPMSAGGLGSVGAWPRARTPREPSAQPRRTAAPRRAEMWLAR